MRLLDLFCGAGGAAVGYSRAGFDIVGVDINPQPNYPFEFQRGNALEWAAVMGNSFDAIHASPPCQKFTVGAKANGNYDSHADLVTPTRLLLNSCGKPYVIENVPGAPLRKDLLLCGSMFGMQVQRHRVFEISGPLILSPGCNHDWIAGRPHTITGWADGPKGYVRKKYLGFRDLAHAKELMDMPWAGTIKEVTESIPHVYTEYIGTPLMEYLKK